YRPGPLSMDMHITYADRKNGREHVEYDHPDLEPILGETYGVVVYQESLMRIATDLAGFSMSDADGLRAAVGKKKRSLMESFKGQFVDGGQANGYDRPLMVHLWDLIEKFAEYGFNKSHTVAYGVVSYQTAWLKAHYPVEYMAALLTSVKNHKDNKPLYLNECRRMGIPVLLPDVNQSEVDFTPVGDEIRFGLSAVRGVGEGIVEAVASARHEHGRFESFQDFCDKVDASVLNKKTLESLILAGAFESLGHPRKGLLDAYSTYVDSALSTKKAEAAGQFSLFDTAVGEDAPAVELDGGRQIGGDEFDKAQRLAFEREMLGLYVSDHPLFGAERRIDELTDTSCSQLRERQDSDVVTVGGVLSGITKKFTRKGDTYVVGMLEDLSGAVEVVFWPRVYREAYEDLVEDKVLVIKGRLEVRDEAIKLQASAVSAPDLSDLPDLRGEPVIIDLAIAQCTHDAVGRLKDVLDRHPGDLPVHLRIARGDGTHRVYRLGDRYQVTHGPRLVTQIEHALRPQAVAEG
ncbi:MAG TPA: DNA polymerase III subunit alpha, partial [Nitriliruptorales bacterium]